MAKLKMFRVAECTTIGTICFVVAYLEGFPGPTSDISKYRLYKDYKKHIPKMLPDLSSRMFVLLLAPPYAPPLPGQ